MIRNVVLGLTASALVLFFVLAVMGSTVYAWWVVLWIIPSLLDQIATRMLDMLE